MTTEEEWDDRSNFCNACGWHFNTTDPYEECFCGYDEEDTMVLAPVPASSPWEGDMPSAPQIPVYEPIIRCGTCHPELMGA